MKRFAEVPRKNRQAGQGVWKKVWKQGSLRGE